MDRVAQRVWIDDTSLVCFEPIVERYSAIVERLEGVCNDKGEVVIGLHVIELKNVSVQSCFRLQYRVVSPQHQEIGYIVHKSLRLIEMTENPPPSVVS